MDDLPKGCFLRRSETSLSTSGVTQFFWGFLSKGFLAVVLHVLLLAGSQMHTNWLLCNILALVFFIWARHIWKNGI